MNGSSSAQQIGFAITLISPVSFVIHVIFPMYLKIYLEMNIFRQTLDKKLKSPISVSVHFAFRLGSLARDLSAVGFYLPACGVMLANEKFHFKTKLSAVFALST